MLQTPTATIAQQLVEAKFTRQTDLARHLGVTPSHLWRILHGERPATLSLAERLAAFYNVPLAVIYQEGQLRRGELCFSWRELHDCTFAAAEHAPPPAGVAPDGGSPGWTLSARDEAPIETGT